MLQLRQIEKAYAGRGTGGLATAVTVLRDVSFDIAAGEFCALLGPSGSGKSTLLNIIGLLDRPDSGEMRLDGGLVVHGRPEATAALRNALIGFVFQSFHLLPRLRAWQNVALPLVYRGVARDERRRRALAMLDRVALADRVEHLPNALSGGQRQRVAIARALVGDPKLLLADEPTGSLDSVTAGEVMALLRDINARSGVTVVMVTHDSALADACDRRIVMHDGRVVDGHA